MPPDLVAYIMEHGYWIIFLLVFSQEIGIPNPVPNELILLYAGYLASTGHFNAILIILIAIAADFIGTSILYGVFYGFGLLIVKRRPKWLPLDKIEIWKEKISQRGKWGIFVGRLIPYVRGYTSAAAGLLDISPKIFMPIVLGSAALWSGGLVFLGKLLGNQVDNFAAHTGWKIMVAGVCVGIFVVGFILPRVLRKKPTENKTPV